MDFRMGGQTALPFLLLVLLCASHGTTQTTDSPTALEIPSNSTTPETTNLFPGPESTSSSTTLETTSTSVGPEVSSSIMSLEKPSDSTNLDSTSSPTTLGTTISFTTTGSTSSPTTLETTSLFPGPETTSSSLTLETTSTSVGPETTSMSPGPESTSSSATFESTSSSASLESTGSSTAFETTSSSTTSEIPSSSSSLEIPSSLLSLETTSSSTTSESTSSSASLESTGSSTAFETTSSPITSEIPSSLLSLETTSSSTTSESSSSSTTLGTTTSFMTPDNKINQCTQREGTSFTVLVEKYINSTPYSYYLEKVLNRLSSRFPCVTRQYTSIILDNTGTNELITTRRDYFLQNIKTNYFSSETYYHLLNCNQSTLYGLKRALEVCPAESIIVAVTTGSMADYNDTQLLSDIYTLLEEKKSQVFFLLYSGYCAMSAPQEDMFSQISLISFGEFIIANDYNYYQLLNSLELLLSKPLNLSVPILSIKLNVTGQYTQAFNVTTSLSYLLITRDDKFTLNFTDPNATTITLEENPNILYNYSNFRYDVFISSHLVKNPAEGTWTLNAWGNGSLTVQILGFTELDVSGNCSDSACHPNATCGEFGGEQQCTCKEGFTGDGLYCDDIDECQDRYTNNCDFFGGGSCVNTIGSYTCNCNSGFEYKEEFGCVDIDECADGSLNTCPPLAVCTNGYGSYTCTCDSKYFDGGSVSCFDPCSNHTVLNDTWRSTSNVHTSSDLSNSADWMHCDSGLSGWYQFKGEYNLQIPEYCVPQYRCGSYSSVWLSGSHPAVSDGIASRTACLNWFWCCTLSRSMSVKRCPEGFYVYKILPLSGCNHAYCTEIQAGTNISTTTSIPNNTISEASNLTTEVQNVTAAPTASYETTALTEETPSTYTLNTPTSTSAVTYRSCTAREGTSFTVLTDSYLTSMGFSSFLENVLNRLSLRSPCVTRQYASIKLDYAEINETITTKQNDFLQSIEANYRDTLTYQHLLDCDQSLLYGLRRALEISPAESIIVVFTSGSMVDYNDTQLLSDVYTLLEEKKSQVYFMLYSGYCTMNATQEELFNDLSSISFKRTSAINYFYYYQLLHSLELLLSKPLNSAVNILDIKLNVADQHTEVFNVTTSLLYLLITRDDKFTLNFTDPNKNTIIFEENPNIPYHYSNPYDYIFISTQLLKNPAVGTWTVNARGNGSLTVQILGFTELNGTRNCSDSDCHPDATCGEFGGEQQCTCRKGFTGDGSHCTDIDECRDQYTNNCNDSISSCVNTIGSYTCNCNTGFKFKEEFGCVDIDECADSSLNNCLPLAVCTNGHGSYTCTCPSRYYEGGVNSCNDPCSNHTVLNDTWRSTSNVHNYTDYLYSYDWVHCDQGMYGWHRFKGEYNLRIPEYCVPLYTCGAHAGMWLYGSHPKIEDGIVNYRACSNWAGCCVWSSPIAVRMCPEGFYVYKIQSAPGCFFAYCTEDQANTTTPFSTTPRSTTVSANTNSWNSYYTTESDISGTFTSNILSTSTSTFTSLTTMGDPSTTADTYPRCTMREGTSFTVLADKYLNFLGFPYYLEKLLNRLTSRFPCVHRQYASVTLDNADTNETISKEKDYFLQIIKAQYVGIQTYIQMLPCNQSLLSGLKRALEISPAESVIAIFTSGSITDYNDAQLLSDVYALLKEKKIQVFVLLYSGYCTMSASQEEILSHISSTSFGEFIVKNDYNYYQLLLSLELHLSKPLNSSVNILNIKLNVADQHTEVFDVATSLSYLLISKDDKFTLNFTDPNENTILFEENPNILHYYPNLKDNAFISSKLVKSPTAGSWILNAQGNGTLIVQILGFADLNITGNCSDSDCHSKATCGEFGGEQQCTCKEGFTGDGSYCSDIDECQDRYTNNCNDSISFCVNAIGSYTCNCNTGFKYQEEFGCVDIDECADGTLKNCLQPGVCTNGYGSYTCNCPSIYYDGGLNSCIDPCFNHTVLNDTWRSTSNTHTYEDYGNSHDWVHCDSGLSGWYRFKGEYDLKIPEYCVPFYSCGTHAPMWINGLHPAVGDGIITRQVCANWWEDDTCCTWSNQISVKMCPEEFYVYKLKGTPACELAYCTESNFSCPDTHCFPDEECRIVNGVSGCYCRPLLKYSNVTGNAMPEDIITECGINQIKVSYSQCHIELLGFNTSSLHLKDSNCTGVIETRDKKYITVSTLPRSGHCGTELVESSSDFTYTNMAYLSAIATSLTFSTNISCTYPRSLATVLWFSTSALVSESSVSLGESLSYAIRMGIFQDSNYTVLFEDPGAWFGTNMPLYIGISVEDKAPSMTVLLMKSCHVTTTSDINDTARYNVISDYCPVIDESTLHVEENGVSLKGRFSLNITEFIINDSRLYIHCQVHLCNTTLGTCRPNCSEGNTGIVNMGEEITNITAGPLFSTGNSGTPSTLTLLYSSEPLTTTGRSNTTVTQSRDMIVITPQQQSTNDALTSSGTTQTSQQLVVTAGILSQASTHTREVNTLQSSSVSSQKTSLHSIGSTSGHTTADVKDQAKLYISLHLSTVLSKSEMKQQILLQINRLLNITFPGLNITAI